MIFGIEQAWGGVMYSMGGVKNSGIAKIIEGGFWALDIGVLKLIY